MLNLDVIRLVLRRYGLVWLGAFGTVLAAALLGRYLAKIDYIPAADLLLTLALPALGLLLVGFLVYIALLAETWLTRGVLVVLTLALALPLLWAPILGVVAGAWVADVSIEYSSVYAGFRIAVGKLLYVITERIFGSPLVESAWKVMQGFAALVGMVSAVANTWRAVQRLSAKPAAKA